MIDHLGGGAARFGTMLPPSPPPSAPIQPPVPLSAVDRPSPGRLQSIVAVVTVISVLAGAAAVGWFLFDAGPQYPEDWPDGIGELAKFVEEYRGYEFDHPVYVYFLTEERYAEISSPGSADPTDQDRERALNEVAQYRAMGLMQGDPDLLAANDSIQSSGTLAFYSPSNDVINVRGEALTPAVRVTLVHELVHALQDQKFNLDVIASATTADASGAARSIVEGDAVLVEKAFVKGLSVEDRAAYVEESSSGSADAGEALDEVPDVLQVLFGSYYVVGESFVGFWQATAGSDPEPRNSDELLRHPPHGTSQLLDPGAYLDDTDSSEVEVPSLDGEHQIVDVSEFGANYFYVMLSERIDAVTALRATDGWLGDAYVSGRVGAVDGESAADKLCVESRSEFETSADANEFRSALNEWKSTMPGAAHIRIDDPSEDEPAGLKSVTFRTCDAGPDAEIGLTGQAGRALAVPSARLDIAASAVTGGRSREDALCYADAVVSRLTLEDIRSAERTEAISEAFDAAEQDCP